MDRAVKKTLLTPVEIRVQVVADEEYDVVGYGDAMVKKEAEKLAALDALLQLAKRNLLDAKPSANKAVAVAKAGNSGTATPNAAKEDCATLSDGSMVTAERAREFMTFYCTQFGYVLFHLGCFLRWASANRLSIWVADLACPTSI